MWGTLPRRTLRVALVLCALLILGGAFASVAMAQSEVEEEALGRELGLKAYTYGIPLLDTQRIFETSTSVNVATDLGYAPVNQFSHLKALTTTKESVVVAPNDDTLYAVAWAQLKPQPVVLHVPEANRFDVVELVSPWTENFANVGTEATGIYPPGNYLLAAPGTDEGLEEAHGLKVIHSPYDRVWLIGRVVVNGPSDTEALPIEEQMKLVPLQDYLRQGLSYEPPKPAQEITEPTVAHIPGTAAGEKGVRFFRALNRALKRFPPPAADGPILKELEAIGVGPGAKLSSSKAVQRGLDSAVASGQTVLRLRIKEAFEAGFVKHDGWLVTNAGTYGTNYLLRAEVDLLGVGALSPNVSIYPLALTDDTGAKLDAASKRFVVHFPASDFPFPVKAFWSITMYEASGFFVSSPIERYALGDRSPLHFEPDGSLNVYVQQSEPTNAEQAENWLPAPDGEFHLVLRLYATEPQEIEPILEGTAAWVPPRIEPCPESGVTAGGQECAD